MRSIAFMLLLVAALSEGAFVTDVNVLDGGLGPIEGHG